MQHLLHLLTVCDRDRERVHDHRRPDREDKGRSSGRSSDWDNETPRTDVGYNEGETPHSRVRGEFHVPM